MARPRSTEGEASTVEATIEGAAGIDAGEAAGPPGVQSTTTETPSQADESPAPGPYVGEGMPKPEQPPVRAAKPDTPIAQTLAAGAGEHTPPDPDEFDQQGRPKGDEESE